MPMKDRSIFEVANRASATDLGQVNRGPADFLSCVRIDARSKRSRDKLGAQTNTEGGAAGCQTIGEDAQFIREKWILHFFIGAD